MRPSLVSWVRWLGVALLLARFGGGSMGPRGLHAADESPKAAENAANETNAVCTDAAGAGLVMIRRADPAASEFQDLGPCGKLSGRRVGGDHRGDGELEWCHGAIIGLDVDVVGLTQ